MTSFDVTSGRQRGFTLTELMIGLVLGAIVVLAATAMVVTSRATYRTQDESTRIQESSRFGLELVNRLVRLTGYTEFGDTQLVPAFYSADPTWSTANAFALNGPNVVGADNASPVGATVNNSDALTIRFYGSGTPGMAGDGNVLDCAGTAVPAPGSDAAHYSTSRAFNVLFVGYDVDNEPSLMCQRQTYDASGNPVVPLAPPQALIRGVETFQVLYGEANFSAGSDPDLVLPTSIAYRTGIGGANPVVNWSNVVTVRIAMLIRSNVGAQPDPGSGAAALKLFGTTYPNYGTDSGAQFAIGTLSAIERTRIRRVVETTVLVRNRVAQWPALN